jgi:hypothetical protein
MTIGGCEMDRRAEQYRPWTADEKERFLDRIGGYELTADELDRDEIRSLLDEEAGHGRP